MGYKDKDKQKEANRARQRRYRAKNKVSALLGQKEGLKNAPELTESDEVRNALPVTPQNVTPCNAPDVTPNAVIRKGQSCGFTMIAKEFPTTESRDTQVIPPGSAMACYSKPILKPDECDIPAHNKATRDRMLTMTITEIEIEQGWCPVWREAMGEAVPVGMVAP